MPALTKEQIGSARDRKIIQIPVPEWANGEPEAYVCIRSLTAHEREQIEAGKVRYRKTPDGKDEPVIVQFTARLAAASLCDDEGERLYDETEVAELAQRSSAVITRIAEEAVKLNGMRTQDQEAARKNSSPARPGDSSSDSPGSSDAQT